MTLRFARTLRRACIIATLAVTLVILYESTQAKGQAGVLDLSTNEAYLGHFAVYGLMAFCALVAIAPRTLQGFLVVLFLATCLGVALELYQLDVPTRTPSAQDAFADAAGAAFGLAAYFTLTMLLEPPKRGHPREP